MQIIQLHSQDYSTRFENKCHFYLCISAFCCFMACILYMLVYHTHWQFRLMMHEQITSLYFNDIYFSSLICVYKSIMQYLHTAIISHSLGRDLDISLKIGKAINYLRY